MRILEVQWGKLWLDAMFHKFSQFEGNGYADAKRVAFEFADQLVADAQHHFAQKVLGSDCACGPESIDLDETVLGSLLSIHPADEIPEGERFDLDQSSKIIYPSSRVKFAQLQQETGKAHKTLVGYLDDKFHKNYLKKTFLGFDLFPHSLVAMTAGNWQEIDNSQIDWSDSKIPDECFDEVSRKIEQVILDEFAGKVITKQLLSQIDAQANAVCGIMSYTIKAACNTSVCPPDVIAMNNIRFTLESMQGGRLWKCQYTIEFNKVAVKEGY